ncbi:MAG: S8 family serine peptidase [Acidimicrobiia bacterium]
MARRIVYALIVTALMVTGLGTAGAAAPPVSQSYIVVLNPGSADVAAVAADLARAHGGQVGFVYEHALEGFSATLLPGAAAAMAKNPLVSYVEADQEMAIAAQDIPTGIERIFADENPEIGIDGTDDLRVDVDVAVIDTGIDFDHPDLNVVARTDCSGGSPFKMSCSDGSGDDGNGHGTHVAGTIGAIDDGNGVVGVAPGARLHAVKVLGDNGSGQISWIIAGIDWVTARAGTIEVANMSLGCECSSSALDSAIAKSVDAGVAYAVAAGNSDKDASTFSPANHPDVLTVSALADFDGEPGGLGSPTCRSDQDDTLADFSNFGSLVEITAPGVCILSTWKDGGYNTISGTSMASPHAAGALALLASGAGDPTNQNEVEALYDTLKITGNFNWTDDSGDGIEEPLLDVSNSTVFNPALVDGSGGGGGDTNSPPTASFTHSCSDLSCTFDGSGSSDSDGSIASYAWDFGDGATATGATASHTYSADGTYTVTLTVTDDDGATGSESKSVMVSSGDSGGDLTLTGSSVNNGSTWTATATLSGPEGSSTSGNWNTGADGGCTIKSEASSCSFSLSGIPKRVSSVTYTDSSDSTLTVTISKP